MILNKQTGQWGTQYDERQDLARFPVSMRQHRRAGRHVHDLARTAQGPARARSSMQWERTLGLCPFRTARASRHRSAPPIPPSRASGKARLAVRYSRPAMRGRTIWGVVVPWDTVWRTGANLATAFETGTGVKLGGVRMSRGDRTRSIPFRRQTVFTLIVSTAASRCTSPVRQPVRPRPHPDDRPAHPGRPMDPFTIWFGSRHGEATRLNWAGRTGSTPFAPLPVSNSFLSAGFHGSTHPWLPNHPAVSGCFFSHLGVH